MDNTPAFPCDAIGDRRVPLEHDFIQVDSYTSRFPGMSLRDYFAGQALKWAGHSEWFSQSPEHAAERAYRMADAMLEARKPKEENTNA